MRFILFIVYILLVAWACPAWATQEHGAPEGLYVHQVAHAFFAITMGLLIFWLSKWHLAKLPGWRSIRNAAILFILWNVDTFFSHWLEEQTVLIHIERSGPLQMVIMTQQGFDWLMTLFYISKLDHLLCVPALLFLFLGLRRLLKTPTLSEASTEPVP